MDLIQLSPQVIVKVLAVLFFVNAALSAVSLFLEKIKDHTETKVDNKIASVVGAVAGGLQKVIDFLSANRAH